MSIPEKRNPTGGQSGYADTFAGGGKYHAQNATAEPLLQRLDRVQKSGAGWRAQCPACGGRSRKLTVTERDERVLLHCFGGCSAADVIAAIGLTWADLHPPRHWPESPEERRRVRRAIREAGWTSAIDQLARDATLIQIAAHHTAHGIPLEAGSLVEVFAASERINAAAVIFVEARHRG